MNNPYDLVRFEAEHHTYAAGWGSQSIDDCPYGDENDDLYKVWMRGFRENKTRLKKVAAPNPPVVVPLTQTAHTIPLSGPLGGYPDLASIPTDVLFTEAAKRLKEGEALLNRVKQLLG
jgi:ribosome modulation factor